MLLLWSFSHCTINFGNTGLSLPFFFRCVFGAIPWFFSVHSASFLLPSSWGAFCLHLLLFFVQADIVIFPIFDSEKLCFFRFFRLFSVTLVFFFYLYFSFFLPLIGALLLNGVSLV